MRITTVNEDIYIFFTTLSMDQLAKEMSQLLEIRLYLHQSPMIGPWYSSEDLDALSKAVREGRKFEEVIETLRQEGKLDANRTFDLQLNDPGDPHYGGPQVRGGGDYILRVRADPDDLVEIEEKLHHSDLQFKLHKRQR